MSMTITFHKNLSERNVIQKTLDNSSLELEGTLRQQTSVTNPVITIAGTSSILAYNYCHIPDFGRYYFITDIESVRNGVWNISLKCDVLMSFASDILSSYAIIDSTSVQDTTNYLPDDIYKSLVKDKTDILQFPSGLPNTGEYILITAGG